MNKILTISIVSLLSIQSTMSMNSGSAASAAVPAREEAAQAARGLQALTNELQIMQEGPLKELGFIPVYTEQTELKRDADGRVIGWLSLPGDIEFEPGITNAVMVAVKLHSNGYSVRFVDSEGNKLPAGLVFDKLQYVHPVNEDHVPFTLNAEYNFWTPTAQSNYKAHHFRKPVIMEANRTLLSPFIGMTSLVQAFGGEDLVYIKGQTPSNITITQADIEYYRACCKSGRSYYKDLTADEKNYWLARFSPEQLSVMKQWLCEKTNAAGFTKAEQNEIIKQVLVEIIHSRVCIISYSEDPVDHIIRPYAMIAEAESLNVPPAGSEQRLRYNAYDEGGADRLAARTGLSKIIAIGGMYQWD